MLESRKKIVVIGAGPGGYPAAFLAADMGMDVTLIDPETNPGGVCLYHGCIPTKTLLHGAAIINEAAHSAEFGVIFNEPEIDHKKMVSKKNEVIKKLVTGLGHLTRQRGINYMQGYAKFLDNRNIEVSLKDGNIEKLTFDDVIIATGTRSMQLPFINMDSDRIMDSSNAMDLPDIPGSMLVIGGGYIGLELGTVYAALGTEVTVVDILPQLLPGADADLVRTFSMRARKIYSKILLQTKVVSVEADSDGVNVKMVDAAKKEIEQRFDKVLLTVGRTPNTDNLGLENTKIAIDDRGFIKVNPNRETDEAHIWAIGDVVGGAMLAHKATAEGKSAVRAINGDASVFSPKAIPAVLFTDPELTWVGITEAEARERGIDVAITKFNWAGSGRCLSLGRMDGLSKLIIEKSTDKVLGVGIVGPGAGELIAEGALIVEQGLTAAQLAHTIHPHPTLSETIMEAAEMYYGECTHQAPPKKR
ncbi:dihydrolipoyl dehydrogenase [bacterium]|nr:dihydrolipoyl dehydrogenase [bacterium]